MRRKTLATANLAYSITAPFRFVKRGRKKIFLGSEFRTSDTGRSKLKIAALGAKVSRLSTSVIAFCVGFASSFLLGSFLLGSFLLD
jgi:hypothetical protein